MFEYCLRHYEYWASSYIVHSGGSPRYFEMHCKPNRYRHEFGAGIGGGVYLGKKKQVFGLYTEALVGQFTYFPEVYKVYWTARVGIEFKFTPNKKKTKNKNSEILPQHREIRLE